ncbi:hypothetical protein GMRT_14239 [Giardia muris]|uniref:Uncharacterized protein n=1 Tax=Giardia muris TaxID=5742 RepID=A0A4Z1TCJ5_GIAMU|nr:hypothetical protein GMRT_14239 [Giardia muris]|eukprot:TNJ30221.1 hypothetical protein GMRT_14239 [Giardia muris]
MQEVPLGHDEAREYLSGIRRIGVRVRRGARAQAPIHSPLYYTLRFILIVYACLVILTWLLIGIDWGFCYLQASEHLIRIRATRISTGTTGLTCVIKSDGTCEETVFGPQVSGIFLDQIIDWSNNISAITDKCFPLGIIVNGTTHYGTTSNTAMSSLSFGTLSTINPNDGYGAIQIVIGNPTRKRIYVTPPWFSYDYWNQTATLDEKGNSISTSTFDSVPPMTTSLLDIFKPRVLLGSLYPRPISMLSDTSGEFNCTHPHNSDQEENLTVPVWIANFSKVASPRLSERICNANYTTQFLLHDFFMLTPLIIRDLSCSVVTFDNANFLGELILDFNGSNLSPVLLFNNSTIDSYTLTRTIDMTFTLSGANDITLKIPDVMATCSDETTGTPCHLIHYGISGQTQSTTTNSTREIQSYRMKSITPVDNFGSKSSFTLTFNLPPNTQSCNCTNNKSLSLSSDQTTIHLTYDPAKYDITCGDSTGGTIACNSSDYIICTVQQNTTNSSSVINSLSVVIKRSTAP